MESYSEAARSIADQCPALRTREASRLFSRAIDAALRPHGLQSSQLSVLVAVALAGEDGAPLGALADRLVMDRTTLTRSVRPLERAGLVRVSRSPTDARVRVATLTRAGERRLEEVYAPWAEATRRIRGAVGAGRMDALHAALGEVIAAAGAG